MFHIVIAGCRDLFYYLGHVYKELGQYKESLEAFENCKKIIVHYYRHYPQHPDVCYKHDGAD